MAEELKMLENSDDLKKAMKKAGVAEKPNFYFLEEVV